MKAKNTSVTPKLPLHSKEEFRAKKPRLDTQEPEVLRRETRSLPFLFHSNFLWRETEA
jgi:hypothetical protein